MADINDAINKAREAASEIVDAEVTQETLPATSGGYSPPINYAKPSMETMGTSTGIANIVDSWLKVDEFGLNIDADRKKFGSILVEIDMTEEVGFITKETIKWGTTPVNYASRFDGMLSDKGEPWPEVVARARRVDPKAVVFPSADIIMTLAEDIEQSKGKDPVKVGTKLGHGLSRSNWQNWVTFYKEVSQSGNLNRTIKVRVTGEEVNGKNGHTWGVVSFAMEPEAA